MTPLAKKLLIVSLVLMLLGLLCLVGIIPIGDKTTGLLVLFPVGAIFFGLFLVVRVLGKESETFDKEESDRRALTDEAVSGKH